jgi:hypothetical protein
LQKYALKLWLSGRGDLKKSKSCYRCHHISESRFCSHYTHALPWWLKYSIDIDKVDSTIDLGPVKHMTCCRDWKPLNSVDENLPGVLKYQFQMGLYLIKYYKTIRKDLKVFLFQDLFSFNNFVDRMKSFLNFKYPGGIIDRLYSYLFYKPYSDILESNIYKKYYDTRIKLKNWAEV